MKLRLGQYKKTKDTEYIELEAGEFDSESATDLAAINSKLAINPALIVLTVHKQHQTKYKHEDFRPTTDKKN